MVFRPSHFTPPGGLVTRDRPDPARPSGPELEAGLPVEVVSDEGDWVEIRCSNGWMAWVEGGRLVSADASAPAGRPADAEQPAPAVRTTVASGGTRIPLPSTAGAWVMFIAGWCTALLSFSPWLTFSRGAASLSQTSWKAPVLFLIDRDADPGGVKLGMLLAVLGMATAGFAAFRYSTRAAGALGGMTLVVTVAFMLQVARSTGFGLGDVGIGAWLTGIAGLTGLLVSRRRADGSAPAASGRAAASAERSTPSEAAPAQQVAPAPSRSEDAGWSPTHRVAAAGADCHERPDAASQLPARLDPGLPVAVDDEHPGWVHVTCSNGYATWIKGGTLEPPG